MRNIKVVDGGPPKVWREITRIVVATNAGLDEFGRDPDEWLPIGGTFVTREWLMKYWTNLVGVHRA